MNILLPCDYSSPQKPDEMYIDQFEAFKSQGFDVLTTNIDELQDLPKILPKPEEKSIILYRGWMLSDKDYQCLVATIEHSGAKPFSTIDDYLQTHHIPNWYPLLREFTSETAIFSLDQDIESELKKLNWGKYFIKDYVKSLKTSIGSIIDNPEQIKTVMSEMEKYRGTIEGGICVRKYEELQPETEKRYFIIERTPYASDADIEIPSIVNEVATHINSKFYSVDIAKSKSGQYRIVEIGDGQVSDIVGWTAQRLAEILKNHV